MKTVAVIPVHGRLPLLKVTIQRLLKKNNLDHVICIGETDEERKTCHQSGAEFLKHANKPLGRKWNYGFLKAKEYHPDFVLYVGSSDWVSDNYLPVILPLAEKVDMIGKPDFNLLHINERFTLANWPGYSFMPNTQQRTHEPIGGGRVLNASWLDKIGWQPFDDYLNNAMDYSMYSKLKAGDKCMMFNSPEIQILAVSCELWSNMHTADFNSGVISFREPELWLKMWFPEAIELWTSFRQTV